MNFMALPNVLNLLREGIEAAKSGDKAKTRQLLTQVTQLDPRNEVAWMWLASVAEDPVSTLNCLRQVLSINPQQARALSALKTTRLQAAINLGKAGKKPQARELFLETLAEDPKNETALVWMGALAEDSAQAISYLEQALVVNPGNENAKAGLGRLKQKQVPVAAWTCPLCGTSAASKMSQCPGCKALLGLNSVDIFATNPPAVDEKKIAAAIRRIKGQPEIETDPIGQMNLGLAFLNLKRFSDALGHFHEAASLHPDRNTKNALTAMVKKLPQLQKQVAEKVRQAAQKTILIVDDSPTIRKVVSVTLEATSHKVVTAADATEAIAKIRNGAPDLVFLDINMPGMDGYELCRLLRQTKETANIPIVMLSGRDGFFSKIRGRIAGSTDYITKPFTSAVLLNVVAKYCGVLPPLEGDLDAEAELQANAE
jgi:twitching motility two-component system response regulator PilG